jgi:hypothetical protein
LTLWQLDEQEPMASCFDALLDCLDDPDPDIPAVAAGLLPDFAGRESQAVEGLRKLLLRAHAGCQARAAEALGRLGEHARPALLELASALGSDDSSVCGNAATALARIGTPLEKRTLRVLLHRLAQAMVDCDYGTGETLAEAVLILADDPEEQVREHVGGRGKEVVKLTLAALQAARKRVREEGDSVRTSK